jgi:hypothetical protein
VVFQILSRRVYVHKQQINVGKRLVGGCLRLSMPYFSYMCIFMNDEANKNSNNKSSHWDGLVGRTLDCHREKKMIYWIWLEILVLHRVFNDYSQQRKFWPYIRSSTTTPNKGNVGLTSGLRRLLPTKKFWPCIGSSTTAPNKGNFSLASGLQRLLPTNLLVKS